MSRCRQAGITLVESLVAILLFGLGLLGLLGMYGQASSATTDAGLRSEGANYASQAAQRIAVSVSRGADAMPVPGSLAPFAMNADTATSDEEPCGLGVPAGTGHPLRDWSSTLLERLPGARAPVIRVSEADSNRVVIRVCWRLPAEDRTRVYELESYVY